MTAAATPPAGAPGPGRPARKQPVHLAPLPASNGGQPQDPRPPEVPVPDVRLVVTVDLTGSYDSSHQVTADLYEQTRCSSDCHTAIVRIGEDALNCCLDLGHAIASRFFLAAQRIEIHVPAGTRQGFLASEVKRHLRAMAADHTQLLISLRSPG